MLGAADRIVTVEFDKKHKKPHLTVENSFNQQCNNGLLINVPLDDNEDNFDVINDFYI